MAIPVSRSEARALRCRAAGLVDRDGSRRSVAAVVGHSVGLQAQDRHHVPLAVRARSDALTAADMTRARVDERSVVRTWCMRGTLHLVATADLSWLTSLFGPLYVGRGERRLAELGFDGPAADRAVAVVERALADDGPLTRDEVADRLLDHGFSFDPDGQASIHLIRRACLAGVACQAGDRDGQESYALLDDWVTRDPQPTDREAALAELARRYVGAYEPATPDDLAAWSGLYRRDVRAGWDAIADELAAVEVDGDPAWIVSTPDSLDSLDSLDHLDHLDPEPATEPLVRLLPMYDSYFLGHADRDLVLPAEHADRVYPGGGVIRAAVVADGLAVGNWRLDRSRRDPVVRVTPFEPLDPGVVDGLEDEVADLGRFLGIDPALAVE